jgi:hypothetical protein
MASSRAFWLPHQLELLEHQFWSIIPLRKRGSHLRLEIENEEVPSVEGTCMALAQATAFLSWHS